MKRKIYYVKKISQKEGREPFPYIQLIVDLGYAKRILTWDVDLISEIAEKTKREMYESEVDVEKYVADFELVEG